MNKNSWKKKLLTELIVFMVVMVIFALSFLTADNQRKQWIEDYGDEAGNFTQNNTPTEAAEISVQAAEDSTLEKPADALEASLDEPQVLHTNAVSPDSKYIAETYGINKNITAAGLYPSREIRIRELATDQIVWSMTGGYGCNLLWTSDSRYLAVSYSARIYAETVIVDTKDYTTVMVPIPEQIEENMQEFRPDVYLYAKEWTEDGRLLIDYRYTGEDSMEYYGTFSYEQSTGDIKEFQMSGKR